MIRTNDSSNNRIKTYNCNISKPLDLSFLIKIAIRDVCYAKSYLIVLPKKITSVDFYYKQNSF